MSPQGPLSVFFRKRVVGRSLWAFNRPSPRLAKESATPSLSSQLHRPGLSRRPGGVRFSRLPSAQCEVRLNAVKRLFALLLCVWWVGCGAQPPASVRVEPTAQTPSNQAAVAARSSAASPVTASGAVEAEPVFHLATAQVNLPQVKLWIGSREIVSAVCHTVPQIATGLMHRTGIGPEETMLFIFAGPRERSFYMKNVPFDIDVAYIDREGVIQEIVRLKANDAQGVPSKSSRIQFVLEAAPEYFALHGFGPGTLISTERGALAEVLGPIAQLN